MKRFYAKIFVLISLVFGGCSSPHSQKTFVGKPTQRVQVNTSDLERQVTDNKDYQQAVDEMLEMSQLAFFERQLKQVDTLVGNGDYEFRGYVFSDIQETLSFSVEWMKDQGWGEDKRVRDVLEEEGLSISALRAGKIDEGVLEEGLALAEQYMERGDALFADSESSWESDLELRLYGGGPGLGMACARAKKEGRKMFGCNTGPAPQVDCAAAGKAEKAGTIVGGVCGGAAVLCAVGAIPTAGAACAGLAVCGGVGGALAAGGAAAGAAGGC